MAKNYQFFKDCTDSKEKLHQLKNFMYEGTIDQIESEGIEPLQKQLEDEYQQLFKDRSDLRSFIM